MSSLATAGLFFNYHSKSSRRLLYGVSVYCQNEAGPFVDVHAPLHLSFALAITLWCYWLSDMLLCFAASLLSDLARPRTDHQAAGRRLRK
jgi:hypothetical protein